MNKNIFIFTALFVGSSVAFASGAAPAKPDDGTKKVRTLSESQQVNALVQSMGCSYEEGNSGMRAIYEGFITPIAKNVHIGDVSASNFMPQVSVSDAKLGFYSIITRMISENPALGGNPNRGFKDHVVLNTALAVMMDNMTLVLPDGTLLSPNATKLSLASMPRERTGKILKSGIVEDAQVFLVDSAGWIIGPNMRPRVGTASVGIDGQVYQDANTEEFVSLAGLMTTKNSSSLKVTMAGTSTADLLQSRTELFGETEQSLMACFQMLIRGEFEFAKDCFKKAGSRNLADATDFAKDAGIGAVRGGVAGGVTGAFVGGIGAGPGAAYGAFANVLTVAYNSFFRKEKLSLNQMNAIYTCVMNHSVMPTETGELLPKRGKWYRTSGGLIRQGSMQVIETTPGKFAKVPMMIDLGGNVIKKPVGFRLSNGSEASGIKVLSRDELEQKITNSQLKE